VPNHPRSRGTKSRTQGKLLKDDNKHKVNPEYIRGSSTEAEGGHALDDFLHPFFGRHFRGLVLVRRIDRLDRGGRADSATHAEVMSRKGERGEKNGS